MLPRPLLLRPDNVTPPARTPWGGRALATRYKTGLGLPDAGPIGESWELSTGPEFPSFAEDGLPLADHVAADRARMLGALAHENALLVKWIDAADDLSVQVHPPDDYAALAPDEAGKPECWYVVDHAPGAGLYVGLTASCTPHVLRDALREGRVGELLRFRAVERGDFVLLPPGTPHAIGAGVVLLEAQRVLPGRRAVTYRYWDWQRRYDASGRPSAHGTARALHVEHALAVTRWTRASDETWLARQRAALGWPDAAASPRCEPICGPDGDATVASDALRVARVCGDGTTRLPAWDTLAALTVVEGEVELDGVRATRGRTLAVPAAQGGAALVLSQAHALISAVCAA